jgi:hypothetical protein
MRPLGVGEVLDAAINLYFRNLGKLLAIALAIVLPLTVAIYVLDLVAVSEEPGSFYFLEVGGEFIQPVNETRWNTVIGIEAVLNILAYLMIVGACFRAVSQLYLGGEADVRGSLGFAARRMHSVAWVSILIMLGVAAGLFALILPAIWLFVAWSVAVPVLMIENLRGTKALGRSYRLVTDNWWRTFGALLVGVLFIALFEFLIGLVGGLADGVAEDSVEAWFAIIDVLGGLATVITAPLQAAIITVIYFNLRVRKEGLDVQMLAQGIEGVPVPEQQPVQAAPAGEAPPSQPPPPTTPPQGGPPPADGA